MSYASTSKLMENLTKEDFDHVSETITTILLTRGWETDVGTKKGSIVCSQACMKCFTIS